MAGRVNYVNQVVGQFENPLVRIADAPRRHQHEVRREGASGSAAAVGLLQSLDQWISDDKL